MIRAVLLIKNNGDPLFTRLYGQPGEAARVPPQIRACATLLCSSSGAAPGRPYILEQPDALWIYAVFDSFVLVMEARSGESQSELKRRATSLGKTLVRSFGEIISHWSGDMGDVEGLAGLVDEYATMDLSMPSRNTLEGIGRIVDAILETHDVAYVGVLDSMGRMIGGNVPETHLSDIKSEIEKYAVGTSVDVVPKAIDVDKHLVQMLKVQSLTVVAASYKEESKLNAIRAVGELANSLAVMLDADADS